MNKEYYVAEKLPENGERVYARYEGVYSWRLVTFWSDGVNDHFGLSSAEADGNGSQPATHWRYPEQEVLQSLISELEKEIKEREGAARSFWKKIDHRDALLQDAVRIILWENKPELAEERKRLIEAIMLHVNKA